MHNQTQSPQVIYVHGNHYQMGLQHAQQVAHLLPAIQTAIDARYVQFERDQPDAAFDSIVKKTIALLQVDDPATLAFIRGQANGLNIDYERLLHYNLITFLRDLLITRNALKSRQASDTDQEGCSTWAATGAATEDGHPILVKNRDYSTEHLPLQLVVRAEPEHGYRYTYITSAGSPGVFVAGFNEAGLAIVDTHVSSTDVGPGLPTYALSMHMLEKYNTVRSALEYLKSTPRLGRNNLLLADATGDVALFEIGHRQFAVLEAENDFLINTNHFVSAKMRSCFVDAQSEALRGSTFKRYALLKQLLTQTHGHIEIPFAQKTLGMHADDPLASTCRHPTFGEATSTISGVIILPVQRQMLFCHGSPCDGEYINLVG